MIEHPKNLDEIFMLCMFAFCEAELPLETREIIGNAITLILKTYNQQGEMLPEEYRHKTVSEETKNMVKDVYQKLLDNPNMPEEVKEKAKQSLKAMNL